MQDDSPLSPEINKYQAILSRDPGSMVFAPLAEAYRKAGMLDEAISTAQNGLKLHPNYVSGMVALGRAYFEKGMLGEARETLGRVLIIAPDNIIANNLQEEINKQWPVVRGQGSEAREQEEAAVEEISEELDAGFEVVEELEPEVIEAVELEELAEVEEIEAEEQGEEVYGEEITEELWTGESVHEVPKIEEEEVAHKKEITTETIAELYIKQGYIDKAIDIYQTIHEAHPYNEEIKRKLDALKRQVDAKEEKQVKIEEEETELAAAYIDKPMEMPEAVLAVPVNDVATKDENVETLESWLRIIQSERRKV